MYYKKYELIKYVRLGCVPYVMYEFICALVISKKRSIRVRTLGRNESCDCHTHIPHPPHTAKQGGEKITSLKKFSP
jgi:hypothetical protein